MHIPLFILVNQLQNLQVTTPAMARCCFKPYTLHPLASLNPEAQQQAQTRCIATSALFEVGTAACVPASC